MFAFGAYRNNRRVAGVDPQHLLDEAYRGFCDVAPVMIWQSGTDRMTTYLNRPWLEFTGRSLEQEVGNGWAEGVHPDDRERCMATYVAAFEARRNFEMEYRLRRHDGEYRWILDRATPLHSANGDFTGYMGGCLDITEFKQAPLGIKQQVELVREQLDGLLDDERRRIADELQDHAAQTFFVIGLVAQAALAELPSDRASDPVAAALVQMGELATAGAKHLREAMFALNNAEVDGRDVVPALWRLVHGFQQRTGIDADLVVTGRQGRLPTDVAETLHAVGRVALANTERHSAASAVVLGLRFSPRSVTLSIQDDSAGTPEPAGKRIADSATRFGLHGVGERVRNLGGTFTAKPGRDGGFVVRARLPYKRGPLIARIAR